ncbi:hypothetical protein SUGI_0743910 [Cryptomeria japonica]|uniref:cytochrome P450 87A3 n=1 Tax=Cryptomeria japonica TaxID=3369 RepID=UPI0024149598|nr:cytochrome P450 87A3 [Cryptomeria japonica]GLJ36847.1 hypothetical protein SUGI_0743910 [Cryptomeria japonica]
MWDNMLVSLVLGLVIGYIAWVLKWKVNKGEKGLPYRLPPGSMGYPIVGETFHFFKPNNSFGVPPFIHERKQRYGSVFKTSIVGRTVVVCTEAEDNNFIFQQEGRLFRSWYPESFTQVFGEQNVGSLHGYMYKYLRNMVLTLVGPEPLKQNFLPQIHQNILSETAHWNHSVLDIKEASASIIFDFTAKKLISYDPSTDGGLRRNFEAFIQGLISFPLDIPGTAYHRCLKGRSRAMDKLKKMLAKRRENPHLENADFFDHLISELNKQGTLLTEDIALDLIFVLLFASFETTSLAVTLALKFVTENPKALKELQEEHEAILARKEDKESELTWTEYKSMRFTSNVINETIRLANIVPGMFRKAMKDVQIGGYSIPAGWTVMVCPTAMHLDPFVFPDPVSFNPWRWQDAEDSNSIIAKHYSPFGGGIRFCVGTDFTKLYLSVFLHCLVTRYTWKAVKGGEILRTPGLSFPNGYHVHFHSKPGHPNLS